MLNRVVYWFALYAIMAIRCLPLRVCFALGQVIGVILWAILPRYRKLATRNLTLAFGQEMSPGKIRRLCFRHFATLGANGICSLKIASLPEEKIARIVEAEGEKTLQRNIQAGRGVVFALSHQGNWELYAQAACLMPEVRFGTVYQTLRNRHVDELINRDRRQRGVATFDRKKGFDSAIALLREPGVVGVLVDQSAGNGGIWMPFFNKLCSTSPLAATLAIRTNAAVVPSSIHTCGFARWRLIIDDEIPYDPAKPEKLTADINAALERRIRESPADWFWVHNRWKTPWPKLLTAAQKRGTYFPDGTDPKKLDPFPIVVRSPNWLGDAVMSLRTVRAFKLGRPDSRLAVLTPEKLVPLWKAVPEVDEIIPIANEDSVFRVAAKIRGRFEAAILLPNSLRSALEAWLAGIPRRVGFAGHVRSFFVNQIIPERKKKALRPQHHADRYWRIAEHCGTVEPPVRAVSRRARNGQLVLGICPGAEFGPAKRWPAERFRKAMEIVSAARPCSWLLLGTAADSPLAAEVLEGFAGKAEDLTGKTSIEELIARLDEVHALLTNDTGTMHLAEMLGVPLVAVFGSTEPRLTGPRAASSRVLRHQVECSPCFLRECPLDFRCMKAVSPEEAAQAILNTIPAGE